MSKVQKPFRRDKSVGEKSSPPFKRNFGPAGMAKLELGTNSIPNQLYLSSYKDGLISYIAQNYPIELCDILEHNKMPVVPDIRIDRKRLSRYGDDAYAKTFIDSEIKTLATKRVDKVERLESGARSLYVVTAYQLRHC